ncbi:hypothetical protein C8F04DRAFT_1305540 [Mycena alexandri]|uniref:Uncharacterized protein n=1 Tax=Mycena alexandri TaxID=1745969 RepID=A0AAD6T8N4_9AGAR|nr:hypothetical protein C8F04DRAFT_1305540 [Mycena alexandri]
MFEFLSSVLWNVELVVLDLSLRFWCLAPASRAASLRLQAAELHRVVPVLGGSLSSLDGWVVVTAYQVGSYFFQIPRGSSKKEFNLGGHCSSPANSLIETLGFIPLALAASAHSSTLLSLICSMCLSGRETAYALGGKSANTAPIILPSIPASTFLSNLGMEFIFLSSSPVAVLLAGSWTINYLDDAGELEQAIVPPNLYILRSI